ncbi:TPA: hypothetical protein ACX6PR_002008 [Photobacterium damselae]|uniref:hypothetical protein n=1 Tax=Photobacterium damselae TaxID=38293 RepID=UPI00159418FB|nr:hypothetical protein [Photobacterium damselae]NVH48440.1 hypothetical protein [Photobacterium damselae subsp. damselae]
MFSYYKIFIINLIFLISGCSELYTKSYQYIVPCEDGACLKTSQNSQSSYKKIDYNDYIYKDINKYHGNDEDYTKVKMIYDRISRYDHKLDIKDIKEIDSILDFLYKDLNQLISIYNFSNYTSELENVDLYRSDNAFLVKELKFLDLLLTENNRQYKKLNNINGLSKSDYELYTNDLKEQFYQVDDSINAVQSVLLNNIKNVKGLIKFFEYARIKYEK